MDTIDGTLYPSDGVFMERESLADGLVVQLLINADSSLALHVIDPLGPVTVPIDGSPSLDALIAIFDHPYSTLLAGRNPWARTPALGGDEEVWQNSDELADAAV